MPPLPETKCRGRIRAYKKNDANLLYFSFNRGSWGRLAVKPSLADALEVECHLSTSSPHTLLAPDVSLIFSTVM